MRFTLESALVSVLAVGAYAQTTEQSVQFEAAIVAAEASCASGGANCAALMQAAIAAIVAAPVPAAARVQLVAATGARVTQSLPATTP